MNGFLFIGDPHLASKAPGRRTDDYVASVLGKLAHAAQIARENDLVPVILGDLFHRARENDVPTLSRLVEVLNSFNMTPIVLGGNHDKQETLLREADALNLLSLTGVVEVYDGETREARRFEMQGRTVALWVAPYGATIPQSIEAPGADVVALITHHDLAFEGAHPGVALLHEIKGCTFVVNGHMHKTAPSVVMGEMVWHNPGNIEPVSVDCIDHKPAVWSWQVGQPVGSLEPHWLPHVRDCFDLTGLLVAQSKPTDAVAAVAVDAEVEAIAPTPTSHFADLLSVETRMETIRAQTSDTFVAELPDNLRLLNTSATVTALIMAVAKKLPAPVIVEGGVVGQEVETPTEFPASEPEVAHFVATTDPVLTERPVADVHAPF